MPLTATLRVAGLLLLAAGAEAYMPLRAAPPARLALRAHAQPLVLARPAAQQIRLRAPLPQASLGAASLRPAGPRGAAVGVRPVRLVWTALCVLVASLGFAARAAMAVERVTLSPMRALAAVGITGEIVAYGVLAGGTWAAWKAFGKHEMPTFYETPDAEREEVDEALIADMGGVQEMRVPRAAPSAPADDAAPANDASLLADLQLRMQQLADAPDDATPDAPSDSTDGWGTGSTAVLEPERPADSNVIEPPSEDAYPGDDANIDFPAGFPLRGEVDAAPAEPVEPIASDDDVAMLERMFGGKLTEDDE